MRLLNVHTFEFRQFHASSPPYAILSHRWTDSEARLLDVQQWRGHPPGAFPKVSGFVRYVKAYLQDIQWIWIDSCCINQDSTAELSRGVNCMFDWYRNARVCVAYLPDVEHPSDSVALRRSVWFTRGWTLQELVASTVVIFVTSSWQAIGHKGTVAHLGGMLQVGLDLEPLLSETTSIPRDVLRDFSNSQSLDEREIWRWMEDRETLEKEDKVYAMFGIFGVTPGANYGEGLRNARLRLEDAIKQKERGGRSRHTPIFGGQKHEVREKKAAAKVPMRMGKLLVSGSFDKTLQMWDAVSGQKGLTLRGHDRPVLAVAFSPDGQLLASGSSDKTVRLWDVASGEQRQLLEGHDEAVTAVVFSPDGMLLASASRDMTVRVWDAASYEQIQKLEGHRSDVNAVTYSPNGKLLASASSDNLVWLWDSASGGQRQWLGHDDDVDAVAFSPDGKLLASTDRTLVRLWNISGEIRQIMVLENVYPVSSVAFSPDGKLLASASWDVTVWDVASGKQRQILRRHALWANAVAFSSDGKLLASASADNLVRLWDVASGKLLRTLEGHADPVKAVAFQP